jgi:hypothetical protein
MVSCQLRNAALALRADFTLLVIAGRDPAIQPSRTMDALVKPGHDNEQRF